MIYFFEGVDESKKTTMAKTVAQITGIPLWERAPYLPHHTFKERHEDEGIFYILDELKTIELLKKLEVDVIIDRHPLISEIVYSEVHGREQLLAVPEAYDFSGEFVFLMLSLDPVYNKYVRVLRDFSIPSHIVQHRDFYSALVEILRHIPGGGRSG